MLFACCVHAPVLCSLSLCPPLAALGLLGRACACLCVMRELVGFGSGLARSALAGLGTEGPGGARDPP